MNKQVALIVSDEVPRRNFLFENFRKAGMQPVAYPCAGAFLIDLQERMPGVLVVDIQMPVERKLNIVNFALQEYPELKVILIGKREFIESKGVYRNKSNVVLCDRIEQLN